MSLSSLWDKVPLKWQLEIESGLHTFVTASVIELGVQLSMNGNVFPSSKELLLAMLAVVLRSGLKSTVAYFTSQANTQTLP